MKTSKSQEFYKRAQKVMVGGVNSPVRSFRGVGGNPLTIKYGRRAQIFDYDGNGLTDYCLSWGALILGHAHPNVTLAAKKAVEKGASFGVTTREEIEIAEFITQNVPSIELIRFVNSGTEATMSAIRLARGFTKKDMIVKFDGCYHGHVDDLLTNAGSGVAQLAVSSSLGIPADHVKNTLSIPYNNVEVLEKTLRANKDKIACVILEAVVGNMGIIIPTKEFLSKLRSLTKELNIVLIFDEVMSGFRAHIGCVQGDFQITPDLTCLGKIIGGGFPVGAYGGRRDIMECLSPKGGVYQAGTFAGNPVVMKAGLAALKSLNKNVYRTLNAKCKSFVDSMNAFFIKNDIGAHLVGYGSMISIRFRREAVMNYDDAIAAQGGERYQKLFWFLLERGIYWPPADLEAFFISTAHSKKDFACLETLLKEFFLNEKNG